MAGDTSPDYVSERTMFAPGVAPFSAAPVAAPPKMPLAEPVEKLRPSTPHLRRAIAVVRGKAVLPSRPMAVRAIASAVSTEIDRGTAFILIPVFLALGALTYFSLDYEPDFLPLAAGVLCLAAIVAATRSRPSVNLALAALLLCILGAIFAKVETWRAGTRMLGGEITTQLTGRIAVIEHLATGRVRLTIDVTGTARPVLRYAPDRVRVSARKVPDGIEAGSVVAGLVRLMPPSGPVRPGSYDFSFESYFDGIGASGYFLRGPEPVSASEPPPPLAVFQASVERARNAIAARIRDRIGGAEGEIAAALVVGVRAGIPDDVNEALRRAGIYHIISISGLHMALVAGTIMGLLRAGFALFPAFSSRRPVKKLAAALAIFGLAAYLFISGAEVAAQRSFIMLAVMLTAVLFDRAALTLRNLAISAIVVILISPHEVTGPSFQMSFAATAALVGAYAAWSDYRLRRPMQSPAKRTLAARILRKGLLATAGLAATSIVAGGATAIYAAWHFQQMPSLGLLTNLTAMPVVSVVVMPFAVLGTLAIPFGLDGPFFDVMGMGIAATIAIARWFSERSPVDIIGLVPPAAVITLTVALLLTTVCTTWLRAASLPVALAGLLMLIDRPHPDLFVSEDARLAGLAIGADRVAVNRARPNVFTIDNWKRALLAETLVAPTGKQEAEGETALLSPSSRGEDAGRQVRGSANVAEQDTANEADQVQGNPSELDRKLIEGFVCVDGLCLARHPSGATVAHAANAEAASRACTTASVIVIDDATARNVCHGEKVLVVTKRDLARRGSAAITFAPAPASGASKVEATIEYAVRQPYRFWHDQRRFSREARGLPPYRRPDASPGATSPAKPSSEPLPDAPEVEAQ